MRLLRRNHRQRPSLLPQLRRQALIPSLLATALAALLLVLPLAWHPAAAVAAEVLQVNGGDRLIIGDGNRTATVILGCMTVVEGSAPDAQAWLRQRLPRHTKVQLRPLGEREGRLLARVEPVGAGAAGDLAAGLVAAGLATAVPCS